MSETKGFRLDEVEPRLRQLSAFGCESLTRIADRLDELSRQLRNAAERESYIDAYRALSDTVPALPGLCKRACEACDVDPDSPIDTPDPISSKRFRKVWQELFGEIPASQKKPRKRKR